MPDDHRTGLSNLAAQADDDVRRDVRMLGIAGKYALEEHVVVTAGDVATASLVRKSDDAVHVRIVMRDIAESITNQMTNARGAIHGRDNGNVVAGANSAVRPHVTVKIPHFGCGRGRHGGGRGLEFVAPREIGRPKIVEMHVIARANLGRGNPDHVAVAPNRIPYLTRANGDLMPRSHVPLQRERRVVHLDRGSARERHGSDNYVIAPVKLQRLRRKGGHGIRSRATGSLGRVTNRDGAESTRVCKLVWRVDRKDRAPDRALRLRRGDVRRPISPRSRNRPSARRRALRESRETHGYRR